MRNPLQGPAQLADLLKNLRKVGRALAERLWSQFFQRMVNLAGTRLENGYAVHYDREDAAISAFRSFYRGAAQGKIPDDLDRNRLWGLLSTITMRKVYDSIAKSKAKKRTPTLQNNVTPEYFIDPVKLPDQELPAEMLVSFKETFDNALGTLKSDDLVTIARLKIEGHTNNEIANQLGRGVSTIERKLRTIRTIWKSYFGC
ncbi:MAG: ECF-type sigma factor [Pirellulaceae bacterium]